MAETVRSFFAGAATASGASAVYFTIQGPAFPGIMWGLATAFLGSIVWLWPLIVTEDGGNDD